MQGGWLRKRRIAALAAASLAVAVATAAAAPSVTTVFRIATIGKRGATTVKCPPSKRAVAGGFWAPYHGLAQQSFPAGGRAWKVEGYDPTQAGHRLAAFARCAPRSPGSLTIVKASKSTAGTPSVPAIPKPVATCPGGTRVLAGGYKVSPPHEPSGDSSGEITVFESRRISGRSWRVSGANEGGTTALVAFAVCERSGRGKLTQASASESAAGRTTTVASARCPAGTHTIGGGFTVPSSGGTTRDSFPSGNLFWKTVFTANGPVSGQVVAYAYCQPG